MRIMHWSIAAGAVALAFLAVPGAEAAPAGAWTAPVAAASGGSPEVVQVAQRCRVQNGRRVCNGNRYSGRKPVRRDRNDNGYYVHDADKLPYGTSRWWDQMLREDRAGTCCG